MSLTIEKCCNSLLQVQQAIDRGASRVELCRNIEVGGLTPPSALIRDAVLAGIPVNVLVRPRAGNFIYSPEEVRQMKESIRECRLLGASGVVIGALTAEGDIDMSVMQDLVGVAKEGSRLSVTFHRAFDEAADPFKALEEIISLGCDRLLTSGQMPTAFQGRELIRELVMRSAGRITVMAGAGITPENVSDIASYCGVSECHGTKL